MKLKVLLSLALIGLCGDVMASGPVLRKIEKDAAKPWENDANKEAIEEFFKKAADTAAACKDKSSALPIMMMAVKPAKESPLFKLAATTCLAVDKEGKVHAAHSMSSEANGPLSDAYANMFTKDFVEVIKEGEIFTYNPSDKPEDLRYAQIVSASDGVICYAKVQVAESSAAPAPAK